MTNQAVITCVILYLIIATIIRYFLAGWEARWYIKVIIALLWPITFIVGVFIAVIKVWSWRE